MKRYNLFLCALSLLVISCGGDGSREITLSWWHFWTDATIKPVVKQIVADFERDHPDVNVELIDLTWADGHDKIAIAFSSGSAPDIVELGSDWVPEFSSTGHLHDITDDVASLRDEYFIWDPAIYDNRIFAFPWILGTRVLFINTELKEQAGYPPDFSPATWAEFLEAADSISRNVEGVYGFGSNSAERHRLYKKFLPFLWSNGGRILSEDARECLLDDSGTVYSLEYYLRLCKTGLTDTQRRLEDAFLDEKLAFIISGDWLLKRIEREKPEFRFMTDVIPPPRRSMPSVSFTGGEYLAINSQSPQKELAFELVRHICAPDNQLRFCLANRTANPASKQAAADSSFRAQPHFDTFITQLETSRMPPAHPKWVYIEGKLEKAIEAALYGTKSVRQALTDACREIEGLLAP